jgi:hypothetical protein
VLRKKRERVKFLRVHNSMVNGDFKLEEVDRAYLAGLFDGEGCASVTCGPHRKMTKKGWKLYRGRGVHLVISNSDKRILKEARFLCGKGGIHSQETANTLRICKPSDVIEVVELIRPYIRVKKEDLQNLEDAAKFILKVRGPEKRHRWTEEEEREFEEFAKTSRALKGAGKRGRPGKYLGRARLI